jgi:hypothetical protein
LEEEMQYRSLALKEIKLVYVGHQVLWRIAIMTKRGRNKTQRLHNVDSTWMDNYTT